MAKLQILQAPTNIRIFLEDRDLPPKRIYVDQILTHLLEVVYAYIFEQHICRF